MKIGELTRMAVNASQKMNAESQAGLGDSPQGKGKGVVRRCAW